MKKLFILFLIILSYQTNWAQQELNNYKYVIVPTRFDFQREANSYRINELTKFLLNKKGFTTLLDSQVLPDDVFKDRCLALKVNLLMKSNFTRTKIKVAFINCQNKVVYTSGEGTSRDKDYKKSYQEAIRAAFKTFDNFKYVYTPKPIKRGNFIATSKPNIKIIKPAEAKKITNIKNPTKVAATEKPIKVVLPAVSEQKVKIKKPLIINGLYVYNKDIYEIAKFQNYYIFSKHIRQGNTFKTEPLGFIYNTSKKRNYLVKTTDTFTGYLLENGNFIIDDIAKDGTIKSKTFIKKDN